MGSTAILIGATALGTALICLFVGFRWGRSNVRSQIEDALDMARVSADAREFALREQLDQKMLELGELRARADEAQSLQEQLAQLQSSQLRNSPDASTLTETPDQITQISPRHPHEMEPVAAVADPIQSFFHSTEQKPKPPIEDLDAPPEPARPPAVRFPASFSSTFTASNSPSEPARPPAVKAVPTVKNDDWDDFAKSLEALKNLQK